MNKNIFLSGVLLAGAILSGCVTTSVSTNYDRSADFSALKTYGWAGEQKPTGDLRFDDPSVRRIIKQSIESELQAKGFQKSAMGQPDFLLKYYITVQPKTQSVNNFSPPDFNPMAGMSGLNSYATLDSTAFHYDEGTFVLDVMDPSGAKILWRGTLQGMIDPGATPAKRIDRVPASVAKVLKNFPPGK